MPRLRYRGSLAILLCVALSACGRAGSPESSLEVATHGVHAAAISRDGTMAAVGSLTQGASLWKLDTRERRFDWNHRSAARSVVTAVALSPEGGVAATAEGSTLVLWDTHTGAALRYFSAPSELLSVALTRGGELALLGLQDGTALLVDARAGGVKRRFGHEGSVLAVAIDPAGTRALTGSADGSARLWDTRSGTRLQRWELGAEVEVLALSDDGTRVFSTARRAPSRVLDADSGQTLAQLPAYASRVLRGESYSAGAFSGDGASLLLGTVDGRVLLWDTVSARLLETWKLPRRGAWRAAGNRVIAVSVDAAGLYVASGDGFIHRLRRPSAR